MVITTHVNFTDDKYYNSNLITDSKRISEKTISLLEGFRPGQTLILKEKIRLNKGKKSRCLAIAGTADGIYLDIDEKVEDFLLTLSDSEIIDWARSLSEKSEISDIANIIEDLEKIEKKDIFMYILDNNVKGNLQIKDVRYSVRAACLTMKITCETKMFAIGTKSKAPEVINETLLDNETTQKITYYAPIYYKDQISFLRNLLCEEKTAWIPTDDGAKAKALVAYLYLNSLNLRQIILTETSSIYKLQYINRTIKLQESDDNDDLNDNNIREIDDDSKVPQICKMEVGTLLGCYSRLSADQARGLRKRYKKMDVTGGGYIFLCPFTIKDFSKELLPPECIQEYINQSDIVGVSTIEDIVYKMVFLHELGHLCCTNTSMLTKKTEDETLANWIASMNITLFEREMMALKTTKQPSEYQEFITLPYYGSLISKTPGKAKDRDTYAKKIIELLKKTAR